MTDYLNITKSDIQSLMKKLEKMGEKLNEREETILMGIFDLAEKALSAQKPDVLSQGSQQALTPATSGDPVSGIGGSEGPVRASQADAALGMAQGGLGGEAVTNAAANVAMSSGTADIPAATRSIPGTPKKKLVLQRQTLRKLNIWDRLLAVEAHSLWTCNGKPVIPGQEVVNPEARGNNR